MIQSTNTARFTRKGSGRSIGDAKLSKQRMPLAEFRKLLKELGWNGVTAAEELRVSANYLSAILNKRGKPSPMLQELLATKASLHASQEFLGLKDTEAFCEILLALSRLDDKTRKQALEGIAILIKAFAPV